MYTKKPRSNLAPDVSPRGAVAVRFPYCWPGARRRKIRPRGDSFHKCYTRPATESCHTHLLASFISIGAAFAAILIVTLLPPLVIGLIIIIIIRVLSA